MKSLRPCKKAARGSIKCRGVLSPSYHAQEIMTMCQVRKSAFVGSWGFSSSRDSVISAPNCSVSCIDGSDIGGGSSGGLGASPSIAGAAQRSVLVFDNDQLF